jgi:hypothetical protein
MTDGPYRAERFQGYLPHTYFWRVAGPSGFEGKSLDEQSAGRIADELNRLHRLSELADDEMLAGFAAMGFDNPDDFSLGFGKFREAVRKAREGHER